MNYQGPRGAGNARNHGLDFIKSNFKRFPYIVWPIDSDDDLMKDAQHQAIKIITKHEGNLFIWSNATKPKESVKSVMKVN